MEWIDVNERLPEKGQRLIAWDGSEMRIVEFRTFSNARSRFELPDDHGRDGYVDFECEKVTHWAPQPTPPKQT